MALGPLAEDAAAGHAPIWHAFVEKAPYGHTLVTNALELPGIIDYEAAP